MKIKPKALLVCGVVNTATESCTPFLLCKKTGIRMEEMLCLLGDMVNAGMLERNLFRGETHYTLKTFQCEITP